MSLEICLEFVVTTSHVRNEFHSWMLHGDLNAMYLRCCKQVANVSPSDIAMRPSWDMNEILYESRIYTPMRCRNQVAAVFHGDFHTKSHSCPYGMSQLGRSCVLWRLSYKVAFMSQCNMAIRSQLCPPATFILSRIDVPMRCRNQVAVVFHGDFHIKSHSCSNSMSQLGRFN